MQQPANQRPWSEAVPPAFVMSAACTVIVGAVLSVIVTYGYTSTDFRLHEADGWLAEFVRYGRPLLAPGFGLAAAALTIIGFAELARRAGPGTDGLLLRAGMFAALVLLASLLAGLYMRFWYMPRATVDVDEIYRTVERFWLWQQRVSATAALAASGALLLAGRRVLLVQGLAMPFLIATAFAFPYETIWSLTHEKDISGGDIWVTTFTDIGIDVAFAASLLAVVAALGRQLPPAPVDVAHAGNGLQRVGSALVARVLLLVVAAFTAVSTFASTSMGLAKLKAVMFPVGFLIVGIALVTGMLQAGGMTAPGAPRKRFYAAAIFTMAALVIETLRAMIYYHGLRPARGGLELEHWLTVLPYATPVLTLAGLLCLLWAVEDVRAQVAAARVDRNTIIVAAAAVTGFTVAGVLTLRWARSEPGDLGAFVLVTILVAIFSVIGQLAVARACHRVSEAMREAPTLPTAVVAPPK